MTNTSSIEGMQGLFASKLFFDHLGGGGCLAQEKIVAQVRTKGEYMIDYQWLYFR